MKLEEVQLFLITNYAVGEKEETCKEINVAASLQKN